MLWENHISLQLDSVPEVTNYNKRPNDKYAWIDTVGWNDSEFEDDETFKDILRFIDDNYMTSIKAVIWNVHPNVRCDAVLTRDYFWSGYCLNPMQTIFAWDFHS